MNQEEIGKRIKEVRKSKNMTQKELAESSKIDVTSISRYETGSQMPNLSTLSYIAAALETSLDYLVFGNATDFKIYKKEARNVEEKIFESLAVLLEENVIEVYDQDGTYIELSKYYRTYNEFISQYDKLKDLKNVLGESYEDARAKLIKSFAIELKDEIKYRNTLPF